jgi:hypothetical protein
MSEATEQAALFAFLNILETRRPDARAFHPANGEKRDKATAAKLQRLGVRRGVPDVLLVARSAPQFGDYCGLAIELKHGRNSTTPEQQEWLSHLAAQRWRVAVCYEWTNAARLVLDYLGISPTDYGLEATR